MTVVEPEAIAVIGMAGRFPGAPDVDSLWRELRAGRELITSFADQELIANGVSSTLLKYPNYVRARGVLADAEDFDAGFFGYSPRDAELLDPQHRVLLECCWHALENAGCDPTRDGVSIGSFFGCGASSHRERLSRHLTRLVGDYQANLGSDRDFLSTRVAYKLNLHGPSLTVQTACSTSLVAVHLACQSLLAFECDVALAGGVAFAEPQRRGYLYLEGGILSPDGHCRPFDARAEGTVPSSGVGVVVLKRLADAVADRDHIRAAILASAINNDGSAKVGYTAPSVDGQAAVVGLALGAAGLRPDDVDYIEAHGTATRLGDTIEIAGLAQAFAGRSTPCPVGSIKSNLGHADAAAGIAGLIKAVLCLEHRELVPSINFETPNPNIDFDAARLYVNAELRTWTNSARDYIAGVSSFGVGGTNAHLLLREPPRLNRDAASPVPLILPLSAPSPNARDAVVRRATEFLETGQSPLTDVAWTLQRGRRVFDHRHAIVVDRDADVPADNAALRVPIEPRHGAVRSVIFMFPGGGSQYRGMARGLYANLASFRDSIDECAGLLGPRDGGELIAAVTGERGAELTDTATALPALFAVEYGVAKVLMDCGLRPDALIGHSLGEYVAACLSGVFNLPEALELVALRGQLFAQLPRGAMLTVNLGEDELRARLPRELDIAAVNAATLCVVAGSEDAIARFEAQLRSRSVLCSRVRIDVAAHSRAVLGVATEFERKLGGRKLGTPSIPFVSNVSGQWITAAEASSASYWAAHLRSAVRFADCIRQAAELTTPVFVEVGPGRALATLAAQNSAVGDSPILTTLAHSETPGSDLGALYRAIASLWVEGAEVNWSALPDSGGRVTELPPYPFEQESYTLHLDPTGASPMQPSLPDTLAREREPNNWIFAPVWHELVPEPKGLVVPCETLVVSPDRALAEGVARRLESLDPLGGASRAVGLEDLTNSGSRGPAEPVNETRTVLVLPPAPHAGDGGEWDAFKSYVRSVLAVGRELNAAAAKHHDFLAVTFGAYRFSASDRSSPPVAGALSAALAMSQEFTNVTCRRLDLPAAYATDVQSTSAAINAELAEQARASVVALRDGRRWLRRYDRLGSAATGYRLRREGTFVITGGLGAIGLLVAEWLVKEWAAKVVLVGRRDLEGQDSDSEEVRQRRQNRKQRITRLRELGGDVVVVAADVTNVGAVRDVLSQARARWGRVDGVIHCAGLVGPDMQRGALETADEALSHISGAKVRGALALGQALDADVEFVLLMSSVASILGGIGLAAYAAANGFLDAYAAQRWEEGDRRWLSVAWEGWRFGQDYGSSSAALRALLEFALSPEEGVRAFDVVFAARAVPALAVSTTALGLRLERWKEHVRSRDEALPPAVKRRRRPTRAPFAPATNDLEAEILRMWESMLGLSDLGINDNFFELGGHSLLAIQLVARMRESLSREISVHDFLLNPTVSKVAAVLESRSTGMETAPTPLVTIQSGDDRCPLFAVHPLGGEVLCYVALANALGPGIPLHAFRAPRLEQIERPESINALADQYLAALKGVRPRGPYALAGWSFGAIVAYEMACRLRTAGDEVVLLALIDMFVPRVAGLLADAASAQILFGRAREFAAVAGVELGVTSEELASVPEDARAVRVLKAMEAQRLIPPFDGTLEEWASRFIQGYRHRMNAIRDYTPRVFAGDVLCIRARDVDPQLTSEFAKLRAHLGDDDTYGWRDLVAGQIASPVVPGFHSVLLAEPHVAAVAELLKESMNGVHQNSTSAQSQRSEFAALD